ncbi:CPBP family intramembrane glutamic endopeptidase [Natrinema salifodinae]|uniref:Membrane protease YdiL, CAAX protease family n=1 Tax=Natrinema salifodinae TaxID=1202768 RepID=A0A1I0NQL6_9EURY|nr:CPBP family intramembrane glutamic endopeptidase [Natrinema salifodinae]SEW03746.1 Membrane protease YdiL, CAAX protease family [Natrinema salifodinae]
MPQWATFVGISGVVLVLLLVLSHLTQSAFTDAGSESDRDFDDDFPSETDATATDSAVSIEPSQPGDAAVGSRPRDQGSASPSESQADADENPNSNQAADGTAIEADRQHRPTDHARASASDRDHGIDPDSLSTGMVLANVAFSQGLFALVLLGAAVYTAIPASALGIEFSVAYLEEGLVLGTIAGLGFYVANELVAAAATHLGFDHEEELRELLSPDSVRGWLILLLGVLPIIAVFEEFLFRAALIGVPAAGFGVSPWLLAVVSSVAFALGHGMQGSVGVVVTGLLGFVLAAVFIVTGSFLVVVVAHYLINALEFLVHEGLGLEWAETLEG